MARKGNSRHIKGLNSPIFFDIPRKEYRYVVKQNPGRHTLSSSVALMLLAQRLNLSSTAKETKKIIKNGLIHVNNKVIRDPKYPVGIGDTIEVPSEKKY